MKFDQNLFNAAVIGENPDEAFIAEGKQLHAVEQHVAELKKEKSDPKVVLPLMREALKALLTFAEGKVPAAYTDQSTKAISLKPSEHEQLVEKILTLYTHLPHHDRNELSSLIHHKSSH
jgi:hypothetical protein